MSEAQTSSDFVAVHRLNPSTAAAWGIDKGYMQEGEAAWLFFRLRETPDSDELFPRGKWASIQHLEVLICEQAKLEPVSGEMP